MWVFKQCQRAQQMLNSLKRRKSEPRGILCWECYHCYPNGFNNSLLCYIPFRETSKQALWPWWFNFRSDVVDDAL